MSESSSPPSTSGKNEQQCLGFPSFPACNNWGSIVQQQLQSSPVGALIHQLQRAHGAWARSPLGRLHRQALSTSLQGPWHPMLASISLGGGQQGRASSKPGTGASSNVLCDMAMARDEVKARLAPIPVYTVANPKNEFVLVAGENNTQLGFFFLKREDAEAIVEKIREENPRLARDSKILRVTMDNVYEVFTTPREQTGLQGIHFRFMPDMQQVSHALELYKEAGVPTRSFVGVPVFQAEGLTVTTQEMQYVPLFLCKEDLGIAVQSAYKQRNATQIKLYRDKAKKHEDDFNQVAVQANSASGREKAALESRAAKAKAKYDAAREKAEAVERAPLPKIEVGSFEEVMMRMTGSSGNELAAWSQVMFVAPNLLRQAVLKDDVTTAGK
uniref:Tic22-like family protein n=1 Tax=Dunaliella tertiolecta TaxID=3047 RepID=A0A7S3VHL0_DUNTE|mmetsp:Transcript_22743/g.62827  ORF Transcript_22743/g.62827 Transcript_22743/m.62827 type:complete len:386 (+) Transcript_22743:58-1215(+)|eukprot:CAMPEP_0202346932 /NCGR_PEP_ID=MMETSP1126-20121109/5509_1 /ASSEMBLY_ACC=CAM_ASM_000457 /TAXON_ID=3047 /ORGANISM="Dunaliella tertiolecta, Strain CCMP1320" /LENGTH=385 /DNA_ID=CAMNT_0048938407 /DNA_START=21 /DNA_END=1178 /DNA_ORIENTATION=-